MRCPRCDCITTSPALGRLPDGRVAFGLCPACLEVLGGERIDDGPAFELIAPRATRRRRRLRARAVSLGHIVLRFPGDRAQVVRLVVVALTGWAALLGVGALCAAIYNPTGSLGGPSPLGNGTSLLLGIGAIAVIGLATAMSAALIAPTLRRLVALRLVEAAGVITALGSLIWGIARHNARHDPAVLVVTALGLCIAALARRGGGRPATPARPAL